ncbi:helix-turn-helix transcriptional regulator [Mucilaginibacter sp. FT3.2]|uniref:helix-turn-helix transcriptional regulator n=1 Tax=Mucilaginibacter sp. FT3.2 TaxID=2723090 RepID=UPI001619C5A9|nr:hypothetical protein [Mucilaginibacter sp. FT3.2]MBB6235320.1 uncharacterized SAM-binding protein YcdF (DUF218 family)/DNA-binding CsgD family transcriptional regulator [Mucilaginibacter sp. FT3.2]
MNLTYTWILARKILFIFLGFAIIFSIVSLVIRGSLTTKLKNTSKLAKDLGQDQSRPEKILLLIHSAEDDFQESLLDADNNKGASYKAKLSLVFNIIDTLLKEKVDTSRLTALERNRVKFWYGKKLGLSHKLYLLKHEQDSLLTGYAHFNQEKDGKFQKFDTSIHIHQKNEKNKTDTVRKVIPLKKKSLFGRLKDAISNKNDVSAIEINHNRDTHVTDSYTQKVVANNKNIYAKKLQQLQQQHSRLLDLQGELISLNTHISNELERLINDVKDLNYKISDDFREVTLKNYKEATILLNRLYTAAFLLIFVFAGILVMFIIQLNKAELFLREENALSINLAQQKIEELVKKVELSEGKQSASQMEELKEIIQLIVNNNPAFLMKFNDYDPAFSKKILSIAPNMVATEIEFCVLLRLNFETKEIARYTKTSVRAVEGKKYRIRKKLDIPSDQDINIWMTNI